VLRERGPGQPDGRNRGFRLGRFANSGNTLTVTNTPGAVINWGAFSIGKDEVTRFVQQNAQSAVPQPRVGGDPSNILGSLSSNGRVFLINPNGITFGRARDRRRRAGRVYLNLSNADFAAGRNKFHRHANAGNIVNQGTINAASGGRIFLVAPNVSNSGVITAPTATFCCGRQEREPGGCGQPGYPRRDQRAG